MRFSFLTGDMNFTRYGGKWISTRRNNGEFDYFFVVELLNWRETVGERGRRRKPTMSPSPLSRPMRQKTNLARQWSVAA